MLIEAILASPPANADVRIMEATRYVDLKRKLHSEVFVSLPLTSHLPDVVRREIGREVQLDLRR